MRTLIIWILNLTQSCDRYRGIVPHVVLSGPTSFAPIIHQSLAIVNETGEFHVLFIIATGHLTVSSEQANEELNENEQKTIDAINLASHFPLSIVIVGVGDGPWDRMKQYKHFFHDRQFDNVHFVDYQVRVYSIQLSESQQICRKSQPDTQHYANDKPSSHLRHS